MAVSVDYFLYDNRSWNSRTGADWGLKARTGLLRQGDGLRELFLRYCRATAAQGHPHAFGAGLGGLPRQGAASSGYLLCVTLESTDLHGRPSWAVVGFWVESSQDLRVALLDPDLVKKAQFLHLAELKPEEAQFTELPPETTRGGTRSVRLGVRGRNSLMEVFAGSASVERARDLLMTACASGDRLPAILGIASFRSPHPELYESFDLVFCHPVDQDAGRALGAQLTRQQARATSSAPRAAEPSSPAVREQASVAPPTPSPTRPPRQSTPPQPISSRLLFTFVTAALLFLLVLSLRRSGGSAPPKVPEIEIEHPTDGRDARPENHEPPPSVLGELPDALEERSPARAEGPEGPTTVPSSVQLDRLESLAARFERLEPEELEMTRAFRLTRTVEVAPKFREERMACQSAFDALLSTRMLFVATHGKGLSYYLQEDGKRLGNEVRLREMLAILNDWEDMAPDCTLLRSAFGFEFERSDSVLSRWCVPAEELLSLLKKGA